MSSADRRSPPGLCGSRIHLGGRVAKQLQNAFSVYFFFPPCSRLAVPIDGRRKIRTLPRLLRDCSARTRDIFQAFSRWEMWDPGFFFCSLGRRGSLSSVDRLQVFHVEWKLGPLSLCHQIQFDCLRVNPQRRIIA